MLICISLFVAIWIVSAVSRRGNNFIKVGVILPPVLLQPRIRKRVFVLPFVTVVVAKEGLIVSSSMLPAEGSLSRRRLCRRAPEKERGPDPTHPVQSLVLKALVVMYVVSTFVALAAVETNVLCHILVHVLSSQRGIVAEANSANLHT